MTKLAFKKIKSIPDIAGFLVTLVMVLLLASCSRGSAPVCVYGDDFGDIVRTNLTVMAQGVETSPGHFTDPGWINTGVDVIAGKSLQIDTQGSIELCPREVTTSPEITVNANNNGWQATGIWIDNNMPWEIISIKDGFNTNGEPTSITNTINLAFATTTVTTDNYTIKDGHNLYAFVGDINSLGDDNWFGSEAYGINNANNYYFAELYDSTIPVPGPRYASEEYFPYSGQLYFRIRDYAGPVNNSKTAKWGVATDFSNNKGAYKVTIRYKKICKGTKGQLMQASIGGNGGISGTIVDLGKYSAKNANNPGGIYNDQAWGTGKLWLRILDDGNKKDWEGFKGVSMGDGDYSPRILTFSNNQTPVNACENSNISATISGSSGSNCGKYYVNIVTTRPYDPYISNIINSVIQPVKDIMYGDMDSEDPTQYGLTKRMYLGLTGNFDFIGAVRATLLVSIVLYAMIFMVGLSKVDATNFITYMIKIAIVVILIGPNSWSFFYNNLFTFFINGTDELIWITSGRFGDIISDNDDAMFDIIRKDFIAEKKDAIISVVPTSPNKTGVIVNGQVGFITSAEAKNILDKYFVPATSPTYNTITGGYAMTMIDKDGKQIDGKLYNPENLNKFGDHPGKVKDNAFAFINQVLARFFTKETNIKIFSLFSTFPLGIIYAMLIYVAMFYFMMAVLRAVIMYIISIIMIGFLLFLAPIFITFILYQKLRGLFDIYLRTMISYVFQPAMLFMVLAIFSLFIYTIFNNLLSYSVCWGCIWHIDLPLNKLMKVSENFDKFCIANGYKVWGVSQTQDLTSRLNRFPITLPGIFIFLILAITLEELLGWINKITQNLTQYTGGEIGTSLDKGNKIMTEAVKDTAGAALATAKVAKPIYDKLLEKPLKKGLYKAARATGVGMGMFKETHKKELLKEGLAKHKKNRKIAEKTAWFDAKSKEK